mmetsp:Transcript_6739/g.6000  ORF Transcript_6739/g.6000 Transcript_6739/m.6000 type:complete len:90 (+) Transcript_6739:831-1100(+)
MMFLVEGVRILFKFGFTIMDQGYYFLPKLQKNEDFQKKLTFLTQNEFNEKEIKALAIKYGMKNTMKASQKKIKKFEEITLEKEEFPEFI